MTLDADTKAEIQSALAAGKEVTTHQAEITVSGWKGAGYLILDPDTGAGAYKISGGASGGWMPMTEIGVTMLSFFIPILAAATVLGPIALIVLGVSLIVGLISTWIQIRSATAARGLAH